MAILAIFVVYAIALSFGLSRAGFRSSGARGGSGARPLSRVLIVGATGKTGRRLVEQALERGFAVTAFARDPTKLRIEHERLTVVRGDVLDPASVAAAMEGQEAVVCALGHKRYYPPNRIVSDGTRNLVIAMKARGVRRLVCQTSLGIGDSAGRLGLSYTLFIIPVVLPFYFWDKTRQERIVAESGLDWVLVRPGALTDAPARGGVRHGSDVGSFLTTASVSRADVAAFALDQLASDAYLRSAPGVA